MRFFTKSKEIVSKVGEVHFQRFAIFECSRFAIYIHKILKEDKDPHLHSHPWNFWTIILSGGYIESFLGKDLFGDTQEFSRIRDRFSVARANRDYFHKILYISHAPIYTLFVTWGKKQPWYYMVGEEKVESTEYRKRKHEGKL